MKYTETPTPRLYLITLILYLTTLILILSGCCGWSDTCEKDDSVPNFKNQSNKSMVIDSTKR